MIRTLTLEFENALAVRLAERAGRAALAPEELVQAVLASCLAGDDPLEVVGAGAVPTLGGRRVDGLLQEGFAE